MRRGKSRRRRPVVDAEGRPAVTLFHRHFPLSLRQRARMLAIARNCTQERIVTLAMEVGLAEMEKETTA